MKKILLSLMAVFALTANADSLNLTPSEATYIQAGNPDTNYSEAGVLYANFSKVSGGVLTDQLAQYGGSDITIVKFDASELPAGCTITVASLTFKSKCTVSSKNSQLAIVPIGTSWKASEATWNNVDKTADGSQKVDLAYSNNTQSTQTYDAKAVLAADEDKIIAFAVFTNTGRQQEVSDFNLAITYSAEVIPEHNYSIAAKAGEVELQTLATGKAFENDNYNVEALPIIIQKDGVCYKLNDEAVEGYSKSFNMGKADVTSYVTYEKCDVTYFFEAEKILSKTYGNANGAYSSGVAAGVYTGANLTMSGIAAGVYTVTVNSSVRRANEDIFNVEVSTDGANWTEAGTITLTSNVGGDYSVENVSLGADGSIRLVEAKGQNQCHYIDYVTVKKTGDYVAPKNTIAEGKYIGQVTIAEVAGVTAPADFKQYVGTHKYGVDLAGDENKLTISGLEILNSFEIVGDAINYDATKTFTMNGSKFTICSFDGTQKEGTLAVKGDNGVYSIEKFGIMKAGKLVGTATNMTVVLQVNKVTEANITFEDVDLGGSTYYNGADEAGLVSTAGDFSFMNYYNADYSSWCGFAVSATRGDNFLGNYGDESQYNSCMAGGMESAQFAVGYYSEYNALMDEQYPEIYAVKNMKPQYAYITNTAAAYISMMNGDTYAKKFTEEDFLKLTITGMAGDEEDTETGHVDFYLAKDGNIVTEWTKVDLTPLGTCASIRFTMDSSDKSYGFINTPCYFALDNMKVELTDDVVTGIKGITETVVKANNGKFINNGRIVIMKNGKLFNAAGAEMK